MGGVRDVRHSRSIDYPIWASEITPVTGKWRLETVEINGEIQMGEVRVNPGDLVVADDTGVVFIPRDSIMAVLELCEKKKQAEDDPHRRDLARRPGAGVLRQGIGRKPGRAMGNAIGSSIAVVGAGAIGSYFGGLLARAGCKVTLIGRQRHVDAINRDGLLFQSGGVEERIPIAATTDIAAVADARLILFCVKSLDTEDAAAKMAPHLAPDAVILSLQNGVDNRGAHPLAREEPGDPRAGLRRRRISRLRAASRIPAAAI